MSLAMTQILFTQHITCTLKGASAYSAGEYMLHYPEYKDSNNNSISIGASNCGLKTIRFPVNSIKLAVILPS